MAEEDPQALADRILALTDPDHLDEVSIGQLEEELEPLAAISPMRPAVAASGSNGNGPRPSMKARPHREHPDESLPSLSPDRQGLRRLEDLAALGSAHLSEAERSALLVGAYSSPHTTPTSTAERMAGRNQPRADRSHAGAVSFAAHPIRPLRGRSEARRAAPAAVTRARGAVVKPAASTASTRARAAKRPSQAVEAAASVASSGLVPRPAQPAAGRPRRGLRTARAQQTRASELATPRKHDADADADARPLKLRQASSELSGPRGPARVARLSQPAPPPSTGPRRPPGQMTTATSARVARVSRTDGSSAAAAATPSSRPRLAPAVRVGVATAEAAVVSDPEGRLLTVEEVLQRNGVAPRRPTKPQGSQQQSSSSPARASRVAGAVPGYLRPLQRNSVAPEQPPSSVSSNNTTNNNNLHIVRRPGPDATKTAQTSVRGRGGARTRGGSASPARSVASSRSMSPAASSGSVSRGRSNRAAGRTSKASASPQSHHSSRSGGRMTKASASPQSRRSEASSMDRSLGVPASMAESRPARTSGSQPWTLRDAGSQTRGVDMTLGAIAPQLDTASGQSPHSASAGSSILATDDNATDDWGRSPAADPARDGHARDGALSSQSRETDLTAPDRRRAASSRGSDWDQGRQSDDAAPDARSRAVSPIVVVPRRDHVTLSVTVGSLGDPSASAKPAAVPDYSAAMFTMGVLPPLDNGDLSSQASDTPSAASPPGRSVLRGFASSSSAHRSDDAGGGSADASWLHVDDMTPVAAHSTAEGRGLALPALGSVAPAPAPVQAYSSAADDKINDDNGSAYEEDFDDGGDGDHARSTLPAATTLPAVGGLGSLPPLATLQSKDSARSLMDDLNNDDAWY